MPNNRLIALAMLSTENELVTNYKNVNENVILLHHKHEGWGYF